MAHIRWFWHAQGCPLIGTAEGVSFRIVGGKAYWTCCDEECAMEEDRTEDRGLGYPIDIVNARRAPVDFHVEHPRFAQEEAEENDRKLAGWVDAAMQINDPATRTEVLESVMAHIKKHGQVP